MLQTETRDALEAERAALALAVEDGNEDALPRLLAVEQQLAAEVLTQQRSALATSERERREAQARAAEEEAARRRAVRELQRLAKERLRLAAAIDVEVTALVGHIEGLLAAGDRMTNTAMRLGAPARAHDARRHLPDWIGDRLAAVESMPGGFGHSFMRAHEGLRDKNLADVERERLAGLLPEESDHGR